MIADNNREIEEKDKKLAKKDLKINDLNKVILKIEETLSGTVAFKDDEIKDQYETISNLKAEISNFHKQMQKYRGEVLDLLKKDMKNDEVIALLKKELTSESLLVKLNDFNKKSTSVGKFKDLPTPNKKKPLVKSYKNKGV